MSELTEYGKALLAAWDKAREPREEVQVVLDWWAGAVSRVKDLEIRLAIAEVDVEKRSAEIAQWIAPDGIQVGEMVSRWHGDTLVSVTRLFVAYAPEKLKYKIEIRKTPPIPSDC